MAERPADLLAYGGQVMGQLRKDEPITADGVLAMLSALRGIQREFAVDQLTHALQTAARAEHEGHDADVVVGALCHDMAKVLSSANHPAIGAELLRPVVRHDVYLMVKYHQVALYQDIPELEAAGPDAVALARRMPDRWDRYAFDPDAVTPPLEYYEPLVREVFGRSSIS